MASADELVGKNSTARMSLVLHSLLRMAALIWAELLRASCYNYMLDGRESQEVLL